MVKKGLRYDEPKIWNCLPFMARIVKILKLLKVLFKIGMVLHVIVKCIRVHLD